MSCEPERRQGRRAGCAAPSAASSAPTTPISITRAPRVATLRATLAAPPGMLAVRWRAITGTGASGEMRSTEP